MRATLSQLHLDDARRALVAAEGEPSARARSQESALRLVQGCTGSEAEGYRVATPLGTFSPALLLCPSHPRTGDPAQDRDLRDLSPPLAVAPKQSSDLSADPVGAQLQMQEAHIAAAGQSPQQVRSPSVKKSEGEKWVGTKRRDLQM